MSQRIFHILIAEDMETTVDLMKYYLNKEFSNLDISVVYTFGQRTSHQKQALIILPL